MINDISSVVTDIISEVRRKRDEALCGFAKKFDRISMRPKDLIVSQRELGAARSKVSPSFLKAIKECGRRIERFSLAEKKHLTSSWLEKSDGIQVGQLIRVIDSVGLYIPGGRFPYPSTVLMTAIPARVAGVRRIVMASPPKNLTPEVLAAASYAGIKTIYRMGGAGAIAALGLGTPTVQKVDLIVGPGNQYVTEAKRQIFGLAGIDSLAGPSEVVIIADASTPVEFIQTDLLAQAEHDPGARAVLLSTDRKLLAAVSRGLDPKITARVQLLYVSNMNKALDQANAIAPEHLELLIKNAERYLPKIRHAGAIFLGPATPAALGDYAAGPSHVLPTSGAARFSSGLSVATFMKRSSVIGFQAKRSERSQWEAALTMAQTEGMEYHGRSLRVRMAGS